MATRRDNYFDSIGRSDGISYNPNAVNVLYRADELKAVQYSKEVFGNRENYLLWLKSQAESNLIELLNTLYSLIQQAGSTNDQIGAYVLAGSAVLSKTGFGVLVAGMVSGVGTLYTFLERKQKTAELELIRSQAKQVETEIAKQKAIYDNAVSELDSIRNSRLTWGFGIAFMVYLFIKNRS